MPLRGNVRYRMKPMKGGGFERLAFRDNKVVETKNMETGSTHTEQEFKQDRKKRGFEQLVT